VSLGTFRELFAYNDWAWDAVAGPAAELPDAKLDHVFEMGSGTIRKTLHHTWGAEKVWLDRWREGGKPPFAEFDPVRSISELTALRRETCAQRDTFFTTLTDSDLPREITFTTIRGNTTHTLPLAPLMLHVCHHGAHHRAQVLNMLKRVGATIPPRGIDYLFMKMKALKADPAEADRPRLSLAMIRELFDNGDWAQQRVLAVCCKLPATALDREFDMGLKTIRATLLHVLYAETWWLKNWIGKTKPEFKEFDASLAMEDLPRRHTEHAAARNAYLSSLGDGELNRMVHTQPAPGKEFAFPLGPSMLQLWHHGAHHRAQLVNMLRHVGATLPEVDVIKWLMEKRTAGEGGRA